MFIGFQHYLEKKFHTPEELSKAWFLNYWGENLHTLGRPAHAGRNDFDRLQAGVDALEPDAGDGFPALAGGAGAGVRFAAASL